MLFVPVPTALTHFKREISKQSVPERASHLTAELTASVQNQGLTLLQSLLKPEQSQTWTTSAFLFQFLTACATIYSQDYIKHVIKACLCHNHIAAMLSKEYFLYIGKLSLNGVTRVMAVLYENWSMWFLRDEHHLKRETRKQKGKGYRR